MTVSPPIRGQVLGHYRIVEQIGAGGMGVVFRARDEQLDRDVALKTLPKLPLLSEPARRQFRREALSLAKIVDPCVAMAFDFGQDGGIDYLVTEYVPGLTLEAKLAGRPLPEGEVLRLGEQMASGLEAAHKEGVIHRDLKPSNVKVTPEGRLKILDFGLAYILKTETELTATVSSPTESYSDAGTLPYMAPEQVRGRKPDAVADVWSAGAVLYEMATGKRPFGDLTGGPLLAAILEQSPVPPRDINLNLSNGLQQVILRALQKDPRQRYQSAGDLRIDLANLASGRTTFRPRRIGRRMRQGWMPLAAAILLLAGGAWWWERHPSGPTAPQERMMAVLPFESVSNDPPTNALGLGLTQTLTAKLVQASDGAPLQLVSTRQLIAQGVKTSDEARREFGTDLVLEGSLQQEGGGYALPGAWLIRANTFKSRPTRSRETPGTFSDCKTIWWPKYWKNCLRRLILPDARFCRRRSIQNLPLTTSTCAAADTWKITNILTTLRARLRSLKRLLLWTETMRRPTRQWAWRTLRVSNGTTAARTGWIKRKANASGRSK